ncbi:MAG TPA: hypothetical protein VE934_12120 [Polaromonas sp.]|uniref:OB-fold protein n=1 Tax=Polaromonas sp. TaxID=1869339 RepID=UPI002D496FF7|nr:hypothetical protein [Polaromonas sp.]HYW57702.1 hypothetical protein [Polaromonas sp.]
MEIFITLVTMLAAAWASRGVWRYSRRYAHGKFNSGMKAGGTFLLVIFAIGLIQAVTTTAKRTPVNAAMATSEPAPVQQSATPSTPPPRILINATASEISKAYEENTVSADMTFKGKELKIVGVVSNINTDFMGDPYLTLKGGVNQFMEPHFSFSKDAMGELARLKKGSKVTVICTGAGDVAKTPMLKNCSLA